MQFLKLYFKVLGFIIGGTALVLGLVISLVELAYIHPSIPVLLTLMGLALLITWIEHTH